MPVLLVKLILSRVPLLGRIALKRIPTFVQLGSLEALPLAELCRECAWGHLVLVYFPQQ